MLKLAHILILVLAVSVGNCQFFYNYEEERAVEPQPDNQDLDPSSYQYNPPSAVNQQFLQPRTINSETSEQSGRPRTRIRVKARNYQTEPDVNVEQPETQPETDQRALRQERRQERKRQRQRIINYSQPTQSSRVYSPSVFENIRLGEAPSGIYVPQDSFLNVLKNPSRSLPRAPQPIAVVPQTTNYVQPAVSYTPQQGGFFVQPPSNDEYIRQPNLILPVTRPQNIIPTPSRQTRNNAQTLQARTVGTSGHTRQIVQPKRVAEPTVDIDSYREFTDDMTRIEIQVIPQVEYVPVTAREEKRSQNRRRTVTRYQVSTAAPRVYSPSIFQNVGLGEAPNGIYVPEDSLLNVLRNPSSGHQVASRANRHQQLPTQPTYNRDVVQNDYLPEVYEEEEYQAPPPPPPPPSRRQSSQRSRNTNTSRRSERRQYQSEPNEQVSVQSSHPSSQRRSQPRNEDFDDFERQPPQSRQQTRPQRRQQTATAPSSSIQTSSSDRGESTRKAKLAIAELPLDTDDDGIPGEAGADYPTLHVIPKTAFSCSQQQHNGYYADLQTSCQVVHLCQAGGVKNSFLCPNGTIFSQEKFSCQWWYKVNCSDSPKFYIKNDELYKVPEKKERKRN